MPVHCGIKFPQGSLDTWLHTGHGLEIGCQNKDNRKID
jgi:hypothetical protein